MNLDHSNLVSIILGVEDAERTGRVVPILAPNTVDRARSALTQANSVRAGVEHPSILNIAAGVLVKIPFASTEFPFSRWGPLREHRMSRCRLLRVAVDHI